MIYDNEFDTIWENIVEKMIEDFSKLFGVKYKPLFLTKKILQHYYCKYKDNVVKTYMVWDTINIDRHKIAACFLKAILITKPLYIPFKAKLNFLFTNKKYEEILSHNIDSIKQDSSYNKYFIFYNEYLAINIAKSIVDNYINSDESPNRFKHCIVMPEPFPEQDHDYLRDICIGLHYSGIRNCNPITYSNVLFLWEKYSCRKARYDELDGKRHKLLSEQQVIYDNIESVLTENRLSEDTISNIMINIKEIIQKEMSI